MGLNDSLSGTGKQMPSLEENLLSSGGDDALWTGGLRFMVMGSDLLGRK
jgi:hypothetical protein